MIIKQVNMTDGGTYRCEYSYGADLKVYTWSNDLTVKGLLYGVDLKIFICDESLPLSWYSTESNYLSNKLSHTCNSKL